MAKSSPTWLAVLLLAVVSAVPMAGQDASVMPEQARPAPCHQHEDAAPLPHPVSYRCCQGGHDFAILQSSPASQQDSFGVTAAVECIHIFALPSAVQILNHVATSSAGPPDLTPLRI